MRKAIVLAVVGLFMASSAALAGEGCGWGGVNAASGTKSQTVVSGEPAPTTSAPKAPKG